MSSQAVLELRDSIFNMMDNIDGESVLIKDALIKELLICADQNPRQADKYLMQAIIDYIEESK